MSWANLQVSPCGTHHLNAAGESAYSARFDEVLKFHAPGLAPVQRGGAAWHIDPSGSAAYARRFIRTFGYYEGLATACAHEGWHHIDVEGADAYDERYRWCGNFQQGRCTVRDEDGTYHHIKGDGRAAYSERWRYAGDYRDGVAVVQAADGRSTHVDRDGALVHEAWFIDLDVFHKGFARARDEGGWTHIDLRGQPRYARRFAANEPFYNGQARVERFDGALEVIDEAGTCLLELRPPRRSEFAALSADMVGFWRTQTIATAVQLRVIEALPATETEAAKRCALHLDGATRLLRALGELDLAVKVSDQWRLSSRGELLRASHPLTLADAALEYAGPLSALWEHLPVALSLGSSWRAPDIFGEVARDEGRPLSHHRMLQSYARHDYAAVCDALQLRGDERIIDAGGGLGVIGQLILDAHPSAHVIVLERPEVVAQAKAQPERLGLHWHSANLFEPWERSADVVLLARVLHDWDDDEALKLLTHAREALPVGGRIFIIELLTSAERFAGALCDLHLMVVTGGRERTADDFARLLNAAQFQLHRVHAGAALPCIIEGIAR